MVFEPSVLNRVYNFKQVCPNQGLELGWGIFKDHNCKICLTLGTNINLSQNVHMYFLVAQPKAPVRNMLGNNRTSQCFHKPK